MNSFIVREQRNQIEDKMMLGNGNRTTKNRLFSSEGAFIRTPDAFDGPFANDLLQSLQSDPGRYFIVCSLSCPWSHKVTLTAVLCDAPVRSVLAGEPRDQGYSILNTPDVISRKHGRINRLHQFYTTTQKDYTGRVTVPILWDNHIGRIVSNNSTYIVEALDTCFNQHDRLCSPDTHGERQILMDRIYKDLSNGVYEVGFARTQAVYDDAVARVFKCLDFLERRLTDKSYLMGETLTVADVHLFPTLVRFDLVYGPLFQCTYKRLTDFPHLWDYVQRLYAMPRVASTIDIDAILAGYYLNDTDRNPHRIISRRPAIDFGGKTGRSSAARPPYDERPAGREASST